MGFKGEQPLGMNIKEIYSDVQNDYPTIRALELGESTRRFEMDVITRAQNTVHKIGMAFPIMDGNSVKGAIEVSDYVYSKDNLADIQSHRDHLIYRKNGTKYITEDIIAESPEMIKIKEQIEQIGFTDSSVLIYGKTGTGKELVAEAIHNCSHRYSSNFISQNCSAIPDSLLEGILFGTTKGSFTGAEDKPGIFEVAEGGTLFLDEINSLNADMQVKLLKAIESKKIRRIGAINEINLNVRIIAATNEQPAQLIKEGRMREDLYYRLSVSCIDLPDLKDRGNDVSVLTNYFINYYNRKMNMHISLPDDEVMEALKNYSWPGNVRELRNVIEGAFALSEENKIQLEDIPKAILNGNGNLNNAVSHRFNRPYNLNKHMNNIERDIITKAFEYNGFKLTQTAKNLSLSKQLLKYKLEKYGVKYNAST